MTGWVGLIGLVLVCSGVAYALGYSRGRGNGAEERGRLEVYVEALEAKVAALGEERRRAALPPISRRGAGDVVRSIAVGDGARDGADVPVTHDG